MPKRYSVISGDSHLELSPDRWRERVPEPYRDRAPRAVKFPQGGDAVLVERVPLHPVGLSVTGGKPYQEHRLFGVTWEGSAGTGSPEQRLKEQDQDGVDAEVLFSTIGYRVWRGIRDDATFRAVVHAYNEFLAEEYCPVAPDRLLALGVIPSTGINDAVAELEYCARTGLKGVMLVTYPSGKGFPTGEDDRFWATAIDVHMPITSHQGMNTGSGPMLQYPRRPQGELDSGFDDPVSYISHAGPAATNVLQLALGGVFDRFPKLRIYFAETMLHWIPGYLEQTDDKYARSRYWAEREYGLPQLERPLSEYAREHCYFGFVKDRFGVEMRHRIGVDHVMWASDFPHAVGDWPNSRAVIQELFEGVPDEERYLMLAGNVVEFFNLDNEA